MEKSDRPEYESYQELGKQYYKIKEVAEMLGISPSTLRYWESEFPECRPGRTIAGQRQYTPANIETLKAIHFLLKVRGMKIELAKQQLKNNPKTISRHVEVIDSLTKVRDDLEKILKALEKRRD